jgi:hypothetical protein
LRLTASGETERPSDARAYPQMTMWPIDKRVGNVKNNDPSLIESVCREPSQE